MSLLRCNKLLVPLFSCCRRLSTMAIEVEFKFPITPLTRQRLDELGATRTSSCQFTDIYYDTRNSILMLNNHWLRKREGMWQMKYASLKSGTETEADAFNELEGQEIIMDYLKTAVNLGKVKWQVIQSGTGGRPTEFGVATASDKDGAASGKTADEPEIATELFDRTIAAASTLDEVVKDGILVAIVEFTTLRERYTYREGEGEGGEVCVDLDQASFGYAVGEVEVMVKEWEEVFRARERTKAIAKHLG